MPLLLRVVRIRPRLFISLGIGALVTLALMVFTDWRTATRLLVGWDIYVGLYLALVGHLMSGADIERIRARAAVEDEGQFAILVHTVVAALTILLSWAFIHTIFALHYAHEFYDEDIGGGLAFPGGETEPDYWDFVYFSFVIGMTSQVSDVSVTHKEIRRTVAAHGVVSFIFNAALLALTVNIAASAI